jgi:drug/metabolite transporter (DMT)-like permease
LSGASRARAGALCMVGATLLWGGTFVVTRDALAAIPPAGLIAGRFLTAGALLAAVALAGRRRFGRDTWIAGLVSAPFVAACYLLQATGLLATSAGSSAFLTAAGTLTVALFAWAWLGERPGRRVTAGIALALLGSALLSWRSGMRFGGAELLTLAGATAYAVALVVVAARIGRVDPVALTAVQTLAAAACVLPFAHDSALAAAGLEGPDRLRFLYLALAGSSVAPLLQVFAQRALPAARIGILFALEPVFALVFAVLFGAERFAPRWWAGAGLILAAVLIVEGIASPAGPRSAGDSSARPATT